MSVTDISELLAARRRYEAAHGTVTPYLCVMAEDLSAGELAHRLRGTGLVLSNRHGMLVLHAAPEPPSAA